MLRFSIRRAMTARTPAGTTSVKEGRSATSLSRPSAASSRTASLTNSGLPFVSRQTAATRCSCGTESVVERMNASTASGCSPDSTNDRVIGSRATSARAAVSG